MDDGQSVNYVKAYTIESIFILRNPYIFSGFSRTVFPRTFPSPGEWKKITNWFLWEGPWMCTFTLPKIKKKTSTVYQRPSGQFTMWYLSKEHTLRDAILLTNNWTPAVSILDFYKLSIMRENSSLIASKPSNFKVASKLLSLAFSSCWGRGSGGWFYSKNCVGIVTVSWIISRSHWKQAKWFLKI